jgi:hypothetical protein
LSDTEFIDRWIEADWLLNYRTEVLGKRLGLIK